MAFLVDPAGFTAAHVTARQMLEFLKVLRTSSPVEKAYQDDDTPPPPVHQSVSGRAAEIVVGRCKHDILELNVVTCMSDFESAQRDAMVHGASTCTS